MRLMHRALLAYAFLVFGCASAVAVLAGAPLASSLEPRLEPRFGQTANVPSPPPASVASPSASRVALASALTPVATPSVPSPSVVARSQGAAPSEILAIASQADRSVQLLNIATGTLSGSVDVGIPPQNMVLAPDGQTAWIFSSTPGELDFARLNLLKGNKDSRRLGDGPSMAAFSTDGRRAYVALAAGYESPPPPSRIVFLDMATDAEFGRVEVGLQSPDVQIQRRLVALGIAPGPTGDVLYTAGQASGTVWALDAGSGAPIGEIEVGGGPFALIPDAVHQRVYVLADTINELIAIDTTTQAVANRLSLPGRPTGAALAPEGRLYIAGGDQGVVWTVDTDQWQLSTSMLVGSHPTGLALSPDGARLYVALSGESSLAVIDASRMRITSRIAVGRDPVALLVESGASGVDATPTPPSASVPRPLETPTLVPSPTSLPNGALPPEHLPSGAVSEAFMPADWPVTIAFAPDGTLFYNELHSGKIRIVRNGVLLPDPFYQFTVSGEPEAGLIGLALDPNFATNHYVYVYYTSVPDGQDNGGPNGPNELVRLTDVEDRGTDLTSILPDLPSGQIHNSGTLRFGPDGKLYVSIGDTDHGWNVQDLSTLAGKILRINSDGSAPLDNPFVGQHDAEAAVWAYGLRNAWSFDFDPLSHNILATQNGPGDNDELDLIVRGGNYGWPPNGYKYKPGVVDPIAVMNPQLAPTGAAFYTGDQIPDWKNDWFYCNYHQGQLRRVRLAPESRDRIVFEEIAKNGCGLNVATGPDGALYYTNPKGIYRIRSANATHLIAAPAVDASALLTETPTRSGTREEDRDIDIGLSEWKLQPSRTTVPAGQLRFVAENTGRTQHRLRVAGQGIDVRTGNLDPGDSYSIQVDLPPGEYTLYCPIPGHQQQGMEMSLTVVGQ